MADRILVSTEEMQATVGRYEQARETMKQATANLDKAWDTLNQVWDGTIKASLMAEWAVMKGNVAKSDNAMNKSIQGLKTTIGLVDNAESEVQSKNNALEVGAVPPMF